MTERPREASHIAMSSKPRRLRAVLVFVAALSAATSSRAAPTERARLVWERGAGAERCISADELARAVEVHAGRPLLSTEATDGGDARVRVTGRVARDRAAGGFRATFEISRSDGGAGSHRVVGLKGTNCRGLDEALVLVLAVAVEPLLGTESAVTPSSVPSEQGTPSSAAPDSTPPPSAGAATASPASSARSGDVEARPPPSSERKPEDPAESAAEERRAGAEGAHDRGAPPAAPSSAIANDAAFEEDTASETPGVTKAARDARFRAAASASVSFGLMPAAAAGFGASVGWMSPLRTSLELGVAYFPFGRSPTDAGAADFRALHGELRACPLIVPALLSLDACGLVQAGTLQAEGRGFPVSDFAVSRLYLAAGGALRARADISPAAFVRLGLQITVPAVRDRFFVAVADREVELHRVAGVVATVGAEAGVAFE